MASIFPDFKTLNKKPYKLSEGESVLLNFLAAELDNSFEIYYKPFINRDCPDIVILKKISPLNQPFIRKISTTERTEFHRETIAMAVLCGTLWLTLFYRKSLFELKKHFEKPKSF